MTSPPRGTGVATTPHPAIQAKVAATRASQGLPPTVEDPAALERAAAVLRLISYGGEPDAMRPPVQRKPRTAAGGGA